MGMHSGQLAPHCSPPPHRLLVQERQDGQARAYDLCMHHNNGCFWLLAVLGCLFGFELALLSPTGEVFPPHHQAFVHRKATKPGVTHLTNSPHACALRRILRRCCKGCTPYCQPRDDYAYGPVATVSSHTLIIIKVRCHQHATKPSLPSSSLATTANPPLSLLMPLLPDRTPIGRHPHPSGLYPGGRDCGDLPGAPQHHN